jgi:hypothetical protein
MRLALSSRERVERDGAFTSRRGLGEGPVARGEGRELAARILEPGTPDTYHLTPGTSSLSLFVRSI